MLDKDILKSNFIKKAIEIHGDNYDYSSIEYFGGEKTFKEVKLRDKNKIEFLKNNNIELLIIKYNEDIKNKLLECLKKF